jgi:hypothetical protein
MLTDLRVKIRTRHSRISSCGFDEFLPYSKQFFAFINETPLLKAVIAELLARNQASVNEVNTVQRGTQLYGQTNEQAATIAYTKWSAFAAQDNHHDIHRDIPNLAKFAEVLDRYRDWYVEPLFDYLDEVLDDANVILATLERYKHKVEWYRRDELNALYLSETSTGERRLAKHMYEYLFDRGIPFHVEPQSASGRPDVVSLDNSNHPFIGDVKIFDGDNRGGAYVRKGFYQVYRYCWDYNEPVGYLIIFNVSDKQLRFALSSGVDGNPRFEYNGKTIFVTALDVHEHEGTASTRPIPQSVTIGTDDLIREVEEAERTEGASTA